MAVSTGPRLERGSLLDLLDEAVRLARAVFPRAFWALALPPVLGSAALATMQAGLMSRAMAVPPGGEPHQQLPAEWLGHWFRVALLGLGVSLASVLAHAGMVRATAEHLEGRRPSGVDSWGWALSWPVLRTLLLAGILVVAGLALCMLPGLYLLVIYAVALPVVALEGRAGYAALARSRSLVTHDRRRRLLPPAMGWVIAVWTTGVVLTYGTQLALQLPLAVAQQVLVARQVLGQVQRGAGGGLQFPGWFWVLQAVTVTAAALARQLVALYSAAAATLLFLRLRARKEGPDLEAALDALGAPG